MLFNHLTVNEQYDINLPHYQTSACLGNMEMRGVIAI